MKFINKLHCFNCGRLFSTEETLYSKTYCPYCGKRNFRLITTIIKQETLEEKFRKLKI